MASTKAEARSEGKEKKDKKDKKRKHSDAIGEDVDVVREKKKKEKKRKSVDADVVANIDEDGDVIAAESLVKAEDEDKKEVKVEIPLSALVPFANPLCGEKEGKKVLKSVKKGKIDAMSLLPAGIANWLDSGETQTHYSRRKGNCQSHSQITDGKPFIALRRNTPTRYCHLGRRHQPDGRHITYSSLVRGPQHPLCLRTESS